MAAAAEPGTPEAKEPARLTSALRIELAKPLDHGWEEVGALLRAQRSINHRLLNAAVQACIEYANRARRGESVAVYRGAQKSEGIPNPSTAAYRACEEELDEIRAWAEKALSKKSDTERTLILSILAKGPYCGPAGKMLSPLVTPATKSVIGQVAFSAFKKWQKDKSSTQVPSWKKGAPLFIRADGAWLERDSEGRIVLVLEHAKDMRVTWALRAGKGSHYGELQSLVDKKGDRRMGDVKVKLDERTGKWFAIIACSRPKPTRPERCDPEHVMVLHRGERNLLVAMTNKGHYLVVARGGKIRHGKRKFHARRLEERMTKAGETGDRVHGHGSERRYETRASLDDIEKNWLRTELQRIGARVRELSVQWGVGTVKIEDYGGIQPSGDRGIRRFLERFPNHQLKETIRWSLHSKLGIELGEYASEFVSQTCPRCGSQGASQHNLRTGIFHCAACKFERPADFVACLHALRRSCDGNAGVWEKRIRAEEKLVEELKGMQAESPSGSSSDGNAGEQEAVARNAGPEHPLRSDSERNAGEQRDYRVAQRNAGEQPKRTNAGGVSTSTTRNAGSETKGVRNAGGATVSGNAGSGARAVVDRNVGSGARGVSGTTDDVYDGARAAMEGNAGQEKDPHPARRKESKKRKK